MKHFRIILLFLFLICPQLSMAVPSRILIIRHAEKPSDPNDPNLNSKGYERARALAHLFEIHPEYASKGLPVAIYASKYVPGKNANRAIQTATPLAKSLGLQLQTPYKGGDASKLADDILSQQEYDGKVVFIVWVHGDIPSLAESLGGDCPAKWKADVFDRVWQLDYDSSSGASCEDLPESVLPGDSHIGMINQ